ncbi:MAG: DNA polymerase I [Deltaproteobacteria bacterium]|jgi:DNA polymerase I|nr:DNA polymerase I [Deltaproteobacteria bacterium]MBT4527364.1 DNA polymerase I [Deltaproteobacteria bacterium]
MTDRLVLVDGNSYIFRAFYGIRATLTNKEGVPTNAVFGFKNMLAQLLRDINPTHCVMVFDMPGPTFRHEIYSEYKANRSATPDDLKVQFEPIFEFVESLNLPMIKMKSYEADDIIGSLAGKFSSEIEVMIISGDKDLTQLINDNVSMYDTLKSTLYKADDVVEKFGVKPEMIPQYLALMGDNSDNIPGAAGIGPKSALKLLKKYGSIEGIYQNINKLAGKQKQNIENSLDNVNLSLRLTQIKCDIPLDMTLDDLIIMQPDLNQLKRFYSKMSFRPDEFITGHPELDSTDQLSAQSDDKSLDYNQYQLITKSDDLIKIQKNLLLEDEITIDLETTSLLAIEAEIVGIAIAWGKNKAVYIPVAHREPIEQISIETALEILGPVFQNENLTIIGQNIKYELMVLANYKVEIKAKIEDTMLQSYLLESNIPRHNLDVLAARYLNHEMIKFEEVAGKGKKQITFDRVPVKEALTYAAEDADATHRIHKILHPKLAQENLKDLYQNIEIPLCRALAQIENCGVKIDAQYLQNLCEQMRQELKVLEQSIFFQAGKEFNINSTQQLGAVLFDDLGLSGGKKKTKTGYSTDVNVLEKIAQEHPIGFSLLQYRTKNKLINTYLSVLPTLVSKKTGRIHTSYNQAATVTGRLSSRNPNLQNIPIRSQDGRKIRKAFIAESGFSIVSFDYSQIELRFLAHLSEDESLLNVYNNNGDIHTETAAAIFGKSIDSITGDDRRAAKAVNFGIIYGMGAFRLAKEIGVSNKQAKYFIESYFARYPKIKNYMDETIAFCRENQYVQTMFRRKRLIPEINAKNNMVKTGAERAAINTRIQGSAADLIKIAMVNIFNQINDFPSQAKMTMQVHDELVFEIHQNQQQETIEIIKNIMQSAIKLKVPLIVDAGVGQNWQEAH